LADSFIKQLLASDTQVVCHIPAPNPPRKIYLPTELLPNAVQMYHLALGHLGQNQLYDTISRHLYQPDVLFPNAMLAKSIRMSFEDMEIPHHTKLYLIHGKK
jgi:hypothetical protein